MADYDTWLGVATGLAALAAALFGGRALWRVYNNREQYEAEEAWTARLRKLAAELVRIGPQPLVNEAARKSTSAVYEEVFRDPRFRALLEQHVVEVDRNRTRFEARNPRPAQLRDPILRETVATAESLLEDFHRDHPGLNP